MIDLLWKYLRWKVTRDLLFETITTLVEEVDEFLKVLDESRAEVLSIIGIFG